MDFAYLFKWIVVGDQSVGKSSVLMRFIQQQFRVDCETTIGVEFASKTFKVRSMPIKLQIWDTAGQEAFQSITRSYYRGTIAALLIYDVSSRSSFEHVGRWLTEATNYATSDHIIVALVGNKIDISNRQVTTAEGQKYANEHGLLFFECSAKSGKGVAKLFQNVAEEVLEGIEQGKVAIGESGGVRLGNVPQGDKEEEGKKRCC